MSSERVLACELQSIRRHQWCRRTSAGATCQSRGKVGNHGHHPSSTISNGPAPVPVPGWRRLPVMVNAAGETENRSLVCMKLVGAWCLWDPFIFPQLDEIYHKSSKVMEMAQKTGWRWNCRSWLSLGNQLKNPNDWRNGLTAHYLVAVYISRSLSPVRETMSESFLSHN